MQEDIDIRSEEIQEILGTPPPWIVRWGLLFVLVFFVMMVWLLYVWPYPETETTIVRIKREEPEVELAVLQSGRIDKILVQSEDTIKAGQAILTLQASGNYEDVFYLENLLASLEKMGDSALVNMVLPNDLVLGELQEEMYTFTGRQTEARNILEGRLSQMSIDEIKQAIKLEETQINSDRRRKQQLEAELQSYIEIYIREDNLYRSGRGDFSELRRAETNKNQWERFVQDAETTIKTRLANIRFLRNQLENSATVTQETKKEAINRLREAFESLKTSVEQWQQHYTLLSPIPGVAVLDDVKEKEYVNKDQRLAIVIPSSVSNLIGKASLDLDKSGQVKEEQKVLVDFYNFPAQQYGAVEGVIDVKHKIVTKDDKVLLDIRFPEGLTTNKGRQLAVGQNMAGKMTIIIEEKRMIEWLFTRF
ncbi:MAG: HlyD family efflux transporter periplasmic adaptor subunit [Saprospiraceae bacterium]